MAAPLEDEDEFTAYQRQKRQNAQTASEEIDEFTAYQQKRRRNSSLAKDVAETPPTRLQSFTRGAEKGATFGFIDEAAGVQALRGGTPLGRAMNIAQRAAPVAFLPQNVADAFIGTGLDIAGTGGKFREGAEARREQERVAREANPLTFMGGEVLGSIAIPVGGTARAATKAGQVAKGIGSGAAASGVYEFASEEGGLPERLRAGAIGAALGGVAGGVLASVIPRDIPLGDVLNAELFGTKVDRPVLKTIERLLIDAGVSPNDISRGVVEIRERLQRGDVGTGLPTRFKDELVKQFGNSARGVAEAIENQIRGGAVRSGSASDAAVRAMVTEDNAAARELFDRSLDQFAGSLNRPELRNQAIEQMGEIVEQRYKPLLSAGVSDPAKAERLIQVLSQPRMQALANELAEDAEREGIDLAALIVRNPAEAAHWMQSKARQLADDRGTVTVTGKVRPDRIMSNRRKDILDALEDAVPGYKETRLEYGDKYGVTEAVNFARGFMSRARDDIAVADMADEFSRLSKAQQDMALTSLRSLFAGSAGNIRYMDPELGVAAIRTAEIGKEPVLRALSEVFGERGTALADDIKQIVTRFEANRRINPQGVGSDTMPKAQAMQFAMRNTRGPLQRALGNVFGGAPLDILGSAFTGGPTPISATRVGIEGLGRAADTRAMSTVDRVTELLLSRPQNALSRVAPEPPMTPPGSTGGMIEQMGGPTGGAGPTPNAMAAPVAETAAETGNAFTTPYLGRQSFRGQDPVTGPATQARMADWEATVPALAQVSNTGQQASEVAAQALQNRTPEALAAAQQAKAMLRSEIEGIVQTRAGMATPEDQRLVDALSALAEQTDDPVLLSTQIRNARVNLDRVLESLGQGRPGNLIPVRTRLPIQRTRTTEEMARTIPERQSRTRYAGGTPPKSNEDLQWNTNQTFYIGSPNKNIKEFKVTSTKGRIGQGVYATPERKLAEGYTKSAATYLPDKKGGGKVYEVYIRGNLASADDFYKALREAEVASGFNQRRFTNIDELDKAHEDVERDAQRILQERGFTGFVRKHDSDRQNFDADEVIVFDPENVRRVDDPMFKKKPPNKTQMGLGFNAFIQVGLGSAGGSVGGSTTDLNGDGVIDMQDVAIGSVMGGLGLPLAGRAASRLDNALAGNRGVRGMGFTGEAATEAPTFYSALARAIDNAGMNRASAEQWKNTIRNMPGVKAEEIEFTGLEDWLDLQTGPVSREDVANYVRNNGVQIEEVVRGAPGADAELQRRLLPLIEERDRIENEMNRSLTSTRERMPQIERLQQLTNEINSIRRETSADTTKWSSYTLPGGENYQEVLMTLPVPVDLAFDSNKVFFEKKVSSATQGSVKIFYDGKDIGTYDLFTRDENGPRGAFGQLISPQRPRTDDEIIDIARQRYEKGNQSMGIKPLQTGTYTSSHWSEPNVLAHTRFKDRTGPNGERVLALEEIQSDWHQAGREQGYKSASEIAALQDTLSIAKNAQKDAMNQLYSALQAPSVVAAINKTGTPAEKLVPDIISRNESDQFVQSIFTNLATAYKNNVRVSEADRAQLAGALNQVRDVAKEINNAENAIRSLEKAVPNAPLKQTSSWTSLVLNRMIRKAADEGYDGVAWIPGDIQNGQRIAASDNRSDFYDKIVVNAANKIGKKYGARVEKMPGLAKDADGQPVDFYYLRITPELQKKAKTEGFPLFAAAPFAVGGIGAGAAMAGDAEAQTSNDLRPDGTLKGSGFLGPLPIRMPDGSSSVATEYSIGVEIDGQELLIPTLVPTLTADQQRRMIEDIIPNNKDVPDDIVDAAVKHALMRMRKGLSPFAVDGIGAGAAMQDREPNAFAR